MKTIHTTMTTISLAFGAALFSSANTIWGARVLAQTPINPNGDQKAYQLAAEQGTSRPYRYVDLQSGKVLRGKCVDVNGVRIKKYVELPTGKILHWTCGK